MQLIPPPELAAPVAAPDTPRRVLVALALLAPLILYFGTLQSIVTIWNTSETFAHGWVVAPISLWLAWRKRDELRTIVLTPYWPAMAGVVLAGLAWLAGTLGEVQVVRQFALVSMFPLAVLAICGRRFAGALAFPLLFLLFAVPVGEALVPPLIELTADFTIGALQLSGIPVLRNGNTFEIPSGHWSVVEACSGLRYLISSVTLGCLYAYLSYRAWWRRALFIAIAITVPVVANWLRAYMIVMIGHLSSMQLATGVDHIIYGWLFFGVVMFLMFWIGRLWQEKDPEPVAAPASGFVPGEGGSGALVRASIAFIAISALWPALAALNARLAALPPSAQMAPLHLAWSESAPHTDWRPNFAVPDARLDKTASAGGVPVGLSILYYRNDGSGHPLISSVNRLANDRSRFHEVGATRRQELADGRPLDVVESRLSAPDGELLVWRWMRIGGHETASNYVGKAWQASERLMMRPGAGSAVILSTPLRQDRNAARATLRAFLDANRGAIDATLTAMEQRR